jgi:hypothetical protein
MPSATAGASSLPVAPTGRCHSFAPGEVIGESGIRAVGEHCIPRLAALPARPLINAHGCRPREVWIRGLSWLEDARADRRLDTVNPPPARQNPIQAENVRDGPNEVPALGVFRSKESRLVVGGTWPFLNNVQSDARA